MKVNRPESPLRRLKATAATLTTLCSALSARADTPDCAGAAPCTLQHTLHMLYWLAGGLACLLLAVVLLASIIYRKNKTSRLLPNSPTERND